ncbi:MAG TPA: ABC transporter permease [Patescibacteria group bacterium]|nr:ABC transporter permease [Patescibacteria group bacterium]
MSDMTLPLTFSLVLVALAISYKEKIGLEKDMLVGSLRAVVQLSIIGLVLSLNLSLI